MKKEKYMESVNIELCFKHNQDVELVEMANALIAIQNLTAHCIAKNEGIKGTKILLKGVREGSDIYSMVIEYGKDILQIADGMAAIAGAFAFIEYFGVLKDKKVESITEDQNLTPQMAQFARTIVAPVEAENSSMTFVVNGNHNHIVIDSVKAKNIREGADIVDRLKGENKKEEEDNIHYKNVLIEMHKTTNTDKPVKHHAYCDDIIKGKSITTYIENVEDRKAILSEPYTNYFLVDIEVNRVGDEVKLYRITRLHDVIPIE